MNWDEMDRYGRGIWAAGAIRFHKKRFWVYFFDPDEGYFMSTAARPEGPWEPVHKMMRGKGWDDCCPFWDEDGQGYLIGTNFSDHYKIHLLKMSADGKSIINGSDKVIYQSKGMSIGQKAGLSYFGSPNYSAIEISYNGSVKQLSIIDKESKVLGPELSGDNIWFNIAPVRGFPERCFLKHQDGLSGYY